jgi:hypothetical protein
LSAWWSYRPSDFLMFSPRIYWRLFESLNATWWPLQVLLVAAALTWLALCWRSTQALSTRSTSAAAAVLGVCWLLTAWAFQLERFAPINAPASAYAVAFALQGLGLIALAAVFRRSVRIASARGRQLTALALGLWALLGHPLLALVSGRSLSQAELFGLAPDPTVIATLAFLLLVQPASDARSLWHLLWWIPLLWCLVSAATLATMGAVVEAGVLSAALTAALAARWQAGSRNPPK